MAAPRYLWPAAGLCASGGLLAAMPLVLDDYQLLVLTVPLIMGLYTVSLAFSWGFAGILCFGQGLYFGIGGYVFAVTSLNMGWTFGALLVAVLACAAVAAVLGYFMFFGRLSDVYLGVVTMVTTLIAWKLMNSASGQIGRTPLGGFNGITSIPTLAFPGHEPLNSTGMFVTVGIALIAAVVCLNLLLRTRFGRVIVAVRENEARTAMLGYDARLHKLAAFVIAAAPAGLAGAFYASSQAFIDPSVFSLETSAQVLIWVMVGGVGSLIGPIMASFALQSATFALASVAWLNTPLLLGVIFCLVALFAPGGAAGFLRRVRQMPRR